jgi:mannitol/fructose-specific phosphotransferase system IIA component (Ntr-type)
MALTRFLGENFSTLGFFGSVDDLIAVRTELAKQHDSISFKHGTDKFGVIEYAALVLAIENYGKKPGRLTVSESFNIIKKDMIERENFVTTGVGYGVAFPQCKTKGINQILLGTYVLKKPMDWQAMDQKPVNLIYPIAVPEDAIGAHLNVMARLSFMLESEETRELLSGSDNSEDLYNTFCKYDVID